MLTAEQQKTELIRAHSEAAAERVDDALSRLEAMQAEHERQAKVDADAAAGVVPAGFPYLARSVGRVMLRKAPPVRSGQVGVLDAGAEVTVEEAAETADGVARLRVVGSLSPLSGWGNADKFERVEDEGGEGAAAMAAAAPAIEVAPPSPARAAKLFASLAPAAIIEQAFLTFASAPDTANAEAGREARASFLWELFTAGGAELSIENLAAFLGRAAARHHMSQPGAFNPHKQTALRLLTRGARLRRHRQLDQGSSSPSRGRRGPVRVRARAGGGAGRAAGGGAAAQGGGDGGGGAGGGEGAEPGP